MRIFVYIKSTENIAMFERTIQLFYRKEVEVFVSTEERRTFRELNNIKRECTEDDIVMIGTVKSLGISTVDVANQLQWFIDKPVMLVICDVNTTYTFGVSQPLNKAVLGTILQSVLENDGRVVRVSGNRRNNSGRSKVEFPEGWEELFGQWENKEISSGEFLEKSGLKKATFYNLISEYKKMKEISEGLSEKYKRRESV